MGPGPGGGSGIGASAPNVSTGPGLGLGGSATGVQGQNVGMAGQGIAGHGAGRMSSPETAPQSKNPYASSGAVPRPGQTGAPSSSIKPQAGKPNLDVYAVGEFPPPAACNVVSTNVGPVPIGTYLEIRSGWSSGEASRLQA